MRSLVRLLMLGHWVGNSVIWFLLRSKILTQCGMSFGTAVNWRLLQSTISPKHEHTSGHRTYWGCWASVRVPRPRNPTAPKKHHHHITRIVFTQADAILLGDSVEPAGTEQHTVFGGSSLNNTLNAASCVSLPRMDGNGVTDKKIEDFSLTSLSPNCCWKIQEIHCTVRECSTAMKTGNVVETSRKSYLFLMNCWRLLSQAQAFTCTVHA